LNTVRQLADYTPLIRGVEVASAQMLREVAERLAASFERSLVDPEEGAVEGVRALMAAAGADNGFLVLGLRLKGRPRQNEICPLGGFRIALWRRVHPLAPEAVRIAREMMAAGSYVHDPMTIAAASHRHHCWAALLGEAAPIEAVRAYQRSPLARAIGAADSIRATAPLGLDGFVVFGLDRARRRARFRAADRDRVLELLPSLAPPLRRLGRVHGLIDGRAALSPREAEIYRLLLTERSEKQIAQALGVTPNRAHELVGSVFQKLGVTGRNGLWAHWTARGG
jgi:DNA-binding CsgD family transcriptional regulator